MRNSPTFLFLVLLWLLTGCKQIDNPIVAKAFHHNLYLSEVVEKIPYSESKEDSLLFMEQYVNEWVLHQTLLAYAKQDLSRKDQDFSSQIKQYKEQLLINAYMQKMTKDGSRFVVSSQELADFDATPDAMSDETPEYRGMVKLNYIKLSTSSKLYYKIKKLLFEEKDRVKATTQLELLCADTIEYYLDNEHWFYTDFIEKELLFSFSSKENIDLKENFDFIQDGNRYLVLILDRKQQLQPKKPADDKKALQLLLQQHKRVTYFSHYQDSLMQKALEEKKAIVYPIDY